MAERSTTSNKKGNERKKSIYPKRLRPDKHLSTGQVAKFCGISQQTVIRCFDSGTLKGFKVPGSRFRRISLSEARTFMKEHGIPTDVLDAISVFTILFLCQDENLIDELTNHLPKQKPGGFDVKPCLSGFETGWQTVSMEIPPDYIIPPDCIIVDFAIGRNEAMNVCKGIDQDDRFNSTQVTAFLPDDGGRKPAGLQKIVDGLFRKPIKFPAFSDQLQKILRDGKKHFADS